MGVAFFYHLTRRSLPDTLMMLLGKSLEQGWRVVVRGTDEAGLDHLDQALWLGPEDGFLPHGRAGQAHEAEQPILLTTDSSLGAGVQCLMSVHGAPVSSQEVEALARVCILFDGNDEAALQHARGQWVQMKEAGVSAQYWSEASGRWEKKAET